MPGRIGELDGLPETPAVMISDSGKIDAEWRIVKLQSDDKLCDSSKYIFPELSLIIDGNTAYAFARNDMRNVPVVYVSYDNCETWSEAASHDIPLSSSKIYSGTLSDGRNYIIGNTDSQRKNLELFVSKPFSLEFNKGIILSDVFKDKLPSIDVWHYPVAYEADGKLYIIYTANFLPVRRAVMTVIDVKSI